MGAGLLRVVKERLGGVLLHNDALLHKHHAVGHMAGKIHLMGDDQHRAALPRKLAHNGQHLAGQLGVKRGGRLVKIEDLGVGRHGACNGYPLLLPAGKLAGVVVGAVIHADLDQRGAGDLLGPAARHFARDDKPLGHVLQRGLVGKQVVALKDKSRAAAQGVGLGVGDAGQVYALVVKQHRAAVGLFQKVQAAQHRCFSAAAGA